MELFALSKIHSGAVGKFGTPDIPSAKVHSPILQLCAAWSAVTMMQVLAEDISVSGSASAETLHLCRDSGRTSSASYTRA